MDDRWDWRDGEVERAAARLSAAERDRDEAAEAARIRIARLEAALLSAGAGAAAAYDRGLQDAVEVVASAIDGYRRLGPAGRELCAAGDREDALFLVAGEIRRLLRGGP